MPYRVQIFLILLITVTCARSQQADSLKVPAAADSVIMLPPAADAPQNEKVASKLYYGGYVGATFGDYSSLEFAPMVGYHVTPVLSAGLRFNYEYVSANQYGSDFNASNYGGSVFSVARIHPNAYLQAEFQYMSYESRTIDGGSSRNWVPFLYLGGGAVKRLSGNVSVVATVLVDVLQDSKSPYKDWTPMFSVGVVAGF